MSRNRIKNSQSLHWMSVLKWIVIVGMLSILGLFYVWNKNQNLHMAEETKRLASQLEVIERRNSQLGLDLERMKSQGELQHRLVKMHSALVWVGSLTVVPMDQNSRMRLAHMSTQPNHSLNLNFNPPVASSDDSSRPAAQVNQ